MRFSRNLSVRLMIVTYLTSCAATTLCAQQSGDKGKSKSENTDLGERLIRDVVSEGDVDVMDKVLRLMNSAAKNLERDFDAGPQTQELQGRVMKNLDEAIKMAAAKRRPMRSRRPPPSGDKRKRSKSSDQKSAKKSGTAQKGNSATGKGEAQVSETSNPAKSGDLRETRRAWGQLPLREREELIQGAEELYLERYREWIERYYRALQETEK